MADHLTDRELTELVDEDRDLDSFVPRVLHLVACTVCRARFSKHRADDLSDLAHRVFGRSELPPVPRRRGANDRWQGLLDRCKPKIDRALKERRDAEHLWNRATSVPTARRMLEVANRRRFHTLGFVHRMMDEVKGLQRQDPRQAQSWCEVALWIAERLSEEIYGVRPLHDIQALIHAFRGNGLRILQDYVAADRELGRAELHLAEGSGEPLVQAEVYFLESSLRRAQQRFGEARELLRMAAGVYRSVRESRRLAAVVNQEAMICREEGDPQAAAEALENLLVEVDVETLSAETRLVLEHNLTTYLTDCGRVEEASRRLPRLRRRAEELEPPRHDQRMRLDWLEAMIRERQGRTEAAEALYGAARDGFLQQGIAYEAALVSLDLAAMYLDHGLSADAARLARELSSLFWEGDLHREAVAALMLFQNAALQETATARQAREVSATLEHLRSRPASQDNAH